MDNDDIQWDAVINFIVTMDHTLPRVAHVMNAYYEARIYKWNPATTQALISAINKHGIFQKPTHVEPKGDFV